MRMAVAGASGLIGSQVVAIAEDAGHEVVRMSRTHGVDLTRPTGLVEMLSGVEAVLDVTRSPAMERDRAVEFFTTVARNLGRAATAAGVRRTVVLSIVGIDRAQDFDWYVATLAHERAAREHCPGTCVLRSTQFHEFPAQVLARSLADGTARVMDVPTQPVDSAEVARTLVEMALDPGCTDLELAGPRVERLVDLVRELVARDGPAVVVEPGPAPTSMAAGAMLPGPGALIRGPDWRAWFAARR
ncbi:MAG: NAD-dependent epimerase/dehydratase family protein [Acidimicrobiia bacterium]